ncbi:DUF4871 domain-containing protein [Peribacillus kribbensis]|uniref:DUF4871 domain-containing protein n=1 Tax=Peribacillus kribbensis TaxID=356658 RepID=UPI00040D60A8|nr:DUF4871 domain-containing protein [Peribacillus kribbensis]
MKVYCCSIAVLFLLSGCVADTSIENTKEVYVSDKDVPSYFDSSVMKDVDWKESPIFSYDSLELRGEAGKVAILSTPWKADTVNKYMWFFFGDSIPAGRFSVIAVKKDTGAVSKALVFPDSNKQGWSVGSVGAPVDRRYDMPASMRLPSKGLWTLNAFIDKKLYGQVVVNVDA